MLCGVKFCGGCNPRYDRGKALSDVKEHFGDDMSFTYAEEGFEYDILLYIAGCVNRCTSLDAYRAAKGSVFIWDETQISEACAQIEDILNN
jgi:hypothetical protein